MSWPGGGDFGQKNLPGGRRWGNFYAKKLPKYAFFLNLCPGVGSLGKNLGPGVGNFAKFFCPGVPNPPPGG